MGCSAGRPITSAIRSADGPPQVNRLPWSPSELQLSLEAGLPECSGVSG